MNCPEARDLIHAYVDGELDLGKTLDIERHIRECAECAAARRSLTALRTAIRDGALYFRAPATLESQIRAKLKQARAREVTRPARSFRWVGAAAAIAVVATTLAITLRDRGASAADGLLASEVTASHVRSLMAEHLWDVRSTDQHTVKPWFDGKVDFAPDVRDFRAESFPLDGGRLDYLAGRPVAALVYRHEKHYINLFCWPAGSGADVAERVMTQQGYVLVHWVSSGMNYWAASDMSEASLRRFASLVRERGTPATDPAK